jgi:pimeloyl-ACP methyl ester carboxylesterase
MPGAMAGHLADSQRRANMGSVTSKDGTTIAFDRSGAGPAIILVTGATAARADCVPLAATLAPHFTVYAYDRRGRGDSGDTLPYAVAREVEDIEAVIDEAGGAAFVFGHSSGAVLALEAARALPAKITKLAVYEPPFVVDDSHPPVGEDYVPRLNGLIAAGRREDAVALFMSVVTGAPVEFSPEMRNNPHWAATEAVAHTIAYDGTIMGDMMRGSPLPLKKWSSVTVPTLVMDGGASPAFMHHGAQALVDVLPDARLRTLAGQDHGPAGEVIVPVLAEFFKA